MIHCLRRNRVGPIIVLICCIGLASCAESSSRKLRKSDRDISVAFGTEPVLSIGQDLKEIESSVDLVREEFVPWPIAILSGGLFSEAVLSIPEDTLEKVSYAVRSNKVREVVRRCFEHFGHIAVVYKFHEGQHDRWEAYWSVNDDLLVSMSLRLQLTIATQVIVERVLPTLHIESNQSRHLLHETRASESIADIETALREYAY